MLGARGAVLESEGRFDEARVDYEAAGEWVGLARLENAAGNFEKGEALARRRLAADASDGAGWLALGDALGGQEKWAEAVEAYVKAAGILEFEAEPLFKLARALKRAGKLDEAAVAEKRWRERAALLGQPVR